MNLFIYLWWKFLPQTTPHRTKHHRHFLPSSFQLIFIHAMRDEMRSEKIKAKETALPPKFNWSSVWKEERRKWLKFQKMFIWWWCYDFPPSRSINRQILITWQSTLMLIHFQVSNDLEERKDEMRKTRSWLIQSSHNDYEDVKVINFLLDHRVNKSVEFLLFTSDEIFLTCDD